MLVLAKGDGGFKSPSDTTTGTRVWTFDTLLGTGGATIARGVARSADSVTAWVPGCVDLARLGDDVLGAAIETIRFVPKKRAGSAVRDRRGGRSSDEPDG